MAVQTPLATYPSLQFQDEASGDRFEVFIDPVDGRPKEKKHVLCMFGPSRLSALHRAVERVADHFSIPKDQVWIHEYEYGD
jgi:hypothetical protein